MTKVNLIENPYALKDIKGLGPKRLQILNEMNIWNVQDLILHLPIRYEDNTLISLIDAENEA
ncbi:DEAD/DEAH box helicase, partial [Staphylococcus equorum]